MEQANSVEILAERVRFDIIGKTESGHELRIWTDGDRVVWQDDEGRSGYVPATLFRLVAHQLAHYCEDVARGDDGEQQDNFDTALHDSLSCPIDLAMAHPYWAQPDHELNQLKFGFSAIALEHGVDVETVGLVLTDDGRFGASPDGMVPNEYGIEIKCPQPHTHVKWLLAGEVPPDHLLQCHGGMYATGLHEWRFVSYCREFPPLVRTVKRDALVMQLIEQQLALFYADMDFAWKKMVNANGGRGPERRIETEDDEHPF